METYHFKCRNPDCKARYSYVGFKTGIGKTPAQLDQMRREGTVCRQCGGPGDTRDEPGDPVDPIYDFAAEVLRDQLRERDRK